MDMDTTESGMGIAIYAMIAFVLIIAVGAPLLVTWGKGRKNLTKAECLKVIPRSWIAGEDIMEILQPCHNDKLGYDEVNMTLWDLWKDGVIEVESRLANKPNLKAIGIQNLHEIKCRKIIA